MYTLWKSLLFTVFKISPFYKCSFIFEKYATFPLSFNKKKCKTQRTINFLTKLLLKFENVCIWYFLFSVFQLFLSIHAGHISGVVCKKLLQWRRNRHLYSKFTRATFLRLHATFYIFEELYLQIRVIQTLNAANHPTTAYLTRLIRR